jgi:molybdenum cofactor biosynthesis enzyme MoaA
MTTPLAILDGSAPVVRLAHLDDLWFQVAGTLCNLECRHCFISCSPHNHRFGFLDLESVRPRLEESVRLGVKEYYFTGGEPFLNHEMAAILELTLQYGPATVLTNATVLKDEWLTRLRRAETASAYSLEFRVSIDGFTAEENDPIRGPGTFERAVRGVRQLIAHGFLPIITITQVREDDDSGRLFDGFVRLLKVNGYDRPRIKILPALRIGAEAQRARGYREEERVTPEMMDGFDQNHLVCNHSRMVTDRGIYVCPILIEAADACLGTTLQDARGGYPLQHHACYTCYHYGTICANASSGQRDA